ncbi:anti-sigma factor antagonist [Streptomyces sp. A7024]|uniref:Anti-sigma factor antagonist n=1 Tax=Streptomyces coryli TaxID=1128680 RepID=A0A6G4U7Z0_9ACTN|nr:anti-sigma factor antagonist [Streptomyces coryli]NGN67417.1 anti-sigma factor antagonist [Streptomyces coryli]
MRLKVCAYDDGDRVVVEVSGEVDLTADHELQQALQEALDTSREGVELDLSGVECLDCSGLSILLKVREQALRDGKSMYLRAVSSPAHRLLSITGTLPLLSPPGSRGTEPDPRVEVVQLRRAMVTRPTIDLARGILMATFALRAEDAWEVLVMVSQNTNIKLHLLADQLVSAIDGEALPDGLQEHVAAAVRAAEEVQT